MNSRIFRFAFIFVLVGRAPADVIPDGSKGIGNELLFEGMERFPGVTFVLAPIRYGSGGGSVEVKKGVNIRFYHLVSPKIYALKAGTWEGSPTAVEDPAVPCSDVEILQAGLVPISETASFIRRVYRITDITGKHVGLERLPDERFDADGKFMGQRPLTGALSDHSRTRQTYLLAGSSLVVVLLVIGFSWVRRGRAASSAG